MSKKKFLVSYKHLITGPWYIVDAHSPSGAAVALVSMKLEEEDLGKSFEVCVKKDVEAPIVQHTVTPRRVLQYNVTPNDFGVEAEVAVDVHDTLWAMKRLLDGDCVRRKCWPAADYVRFYTDATYARKYYGTFDQRTNAVYSFMTPADLLATDWELHVDPN